MKKKQKKKKRQNADVGGKRGSKHTLSIYLDSCSRFQLLLSFSFFFLFFSRVFYFLRQLSLFTHCNSTIYTLLMGFITTIFKKYILKMSPTVLFTHLKIILLQYFQFSKQTLSQKPNLLMIKI